MAAGSKQYKFEEVASHDNISDLWLVIAGKVYDVTEFMDEHPGGSEVLLSATGKDATDDFEDVGHSEQARGMMEKYCIGEVVAATVPKHRTFAPPPTPANQSSTSDLLLKLLRVLLPILILSVAFFVRKYTKSE